MGGFYPHVERGRPKSTPPGNFDPAELDTHRYPFALVYVLNEHFFCGGLTDVAFRSDRKSPR